MIFCNIGIAQTLISMNNPLTSSTQITPDTLGAERIESYRRDGFVHIPGILSLDEAAKFRQAALDFQARRTQGAASVGRSVFSQFVNVWQEDEAMRTLTLHPYIAAIAERLAGVPLRLWHDQILIKEPHNQAPTEFHQDQPYWPHEGSVHPISAWIALQDVPVERGCMTFLPGSQGRTELPMQNLQDSNSLFAICPDFRWQPRVTVPLRAGDCTFHHGRCAHMATPNFTDEARVAQVVIFVDAATRFNGDPHPVTAKFGLVPGQQLEGEWFPTAQHILASIK